jgi:hypothetical protein
MNKFYSLTAALLIGFLSHAQQIVALWNYDGITGAPVTTSANVGLGTSSVVGSMVVATAATGMDPIINNGCGSQNGTNPGAWSFTSNPGTTNESSGVQFSASTVGVQNIKFTWDQRWSNTATNTVRLQYTLDGSTWINFTMTSQNTSFCNGSLDNGRFQNNGIGDQYRRISVNMSEITGADNNSNFGVRILAANYQTTSEFRQTSNPTLIATGGTWRFDNVSIQGQADVSIASASNFVVYNENAGTVNVPVTIANANTADVTLTFGLSTYSNAITNEDYTWTPSLTIPANTNGVINLPVSILDDANAEKAERIIVKLLSGTNANISLTNNYQIIFIKDNDYVAPTPTNELNMTLLSSFSNGTTGANSAEITAFDPSVDRLYIANSIAGKLDIVNFSNPAAPVLITSLSLSAYGNINSVVAHDSVIALAIESVPAQTNGKVVFFDYNGTYINQVTVGAMPDMITFTNNFTKLLTANEGEPNADYSVDPEGSVSIIDLTSGYAALTNANVTTLGFTAYNGQEAALRAQGIRIFTTSATVAQDLEPEYIAISDDNTKAYVTLQENNALLTINLQTSTIQSLTALGYASYAAGSNNGLDASDQSGAVLITGELPIKGTYMPDAMAYKTINGQGYLLTANEGDSREFGSVIDANRISSSAFTNLLDPTAFPDQAILRNNKFLGRLSALKYSGDTDGDGDYDELHVMGGRSFSIWNPTTGALVFDSKDLIEQITANHPTFGAIFNASNSTGTPALKNRSDDKGPEPEGVAVAEINGSTYAFVSLERIGGVMIFNVDNPTQPVFVGYTNNRSTTVSGPDLGAEGIIIIPASDSPNGQTLVVLANEVSSTLSIYQVNTCAELSGGALTSTATTVCSGDNVVISSQAVNGVNYQWLESGNLVSGATANTITTTLAGNYSLAFANSTLACVDTSSVVSVQVNQLPNVDAGANLTVCQGNAVTLTAAGASTYTWNNGVQNNVAFTPANSGSYIVEGIDANGCTDLDTVALTVATYPSANAGIDQVLCESNMPLTLVAVSNQFNVNYAWNTGQTSSQIQVNSSTVALVTVTNAAGCSTVDSVVVEVNANPIIDLGSDSTVCENWLPLSLTPSSTANLTTYNWSTGETTPSISIDQAGTYGVTVRDVNNCESQDEITISVESCLGLDELEAEVTVYPNPATSAITIASSFEGGMNVMVYSLEGRLIESVQTEQAEFAIDCSDWATGTYRVVMQQNQHVTERLIIKN